MRSSSYFNDPFFCRLETREHNPDYKLILLRPLFFQQKSSAVDKQTISRDLDLMRLACLNHESFENAVIEINPTVYAQGKKGLSIVDQTHGFPVLRLKPYSTSKNPYTGKDNPSRLSAFYYALEDVHRNKTKILELMWDKRNSEWVDIEPSIKQQLDYSYLTKKKVS